MAANGNDIENRLWAVADQLWANSGLRPAEFSTPVLGLIFLRYAEKRFAELEARIGPVGSGGRRRIGKEDFQAEGVIFLPPEARFSHLQSLPEGEDIGRAINDAMQAIENENADLSGVLPHTYTQIDDAILVELIKLLGPMEIEGDAFGKVYEYFLGNFAMREGQKGGVFYTPTSIVRLIVEIIEPYHGRIFDPACGSGGMFVQSADFVTAHSANWGVLIQYPLPTPPDSLLRRFNEVVEAVIDQTRNLMLRNTNLRAQRDLLLPKLVSGEIDVSELETIEEAAA